MNELKLLKPDLKYASQIMEYKEEFIRSQDSMDGSAGLMKFDDAAEWIDYLKITGNPETCPPERVSDSEFLTVRVTDDRIVGMVNIRHDLNEHLLQFGGNIGYSIRKSERRKGYAKEQLRLALEECRKLGLTKVLITCDKENPGSRKTILSAGGIMENEVSEGKRITQRFWINI